MYVIAGAAGNVGSGVARALLKAGKPVTALVRSPEKALRWRNEGAEAAVLDLTDTAALTKVLTGAAGVFLMVPPNYSDPDYLRSSRELIDSLATAVEDSAVEHAVFLSSVRARHASGTGPVITLHWGEQALRTAVPNLTVLRAVYLTENWAAALPAALARGVLPTFLAPDTRIDMIATADVSGFVADSLLRPAHGHQVRAIAGPDRYTPHDIASALSDLVGKPVRLAPVPAEDTTAAFIEQGFPPPVAELLAELYTGIASGHSDHPSDDDAAVERGTTTPREVLATLLQSQAH